jgi:hypothetical protein
MFFSDYGSFLFDKWIVRPHHLFNSTEVHLICDHPNRKGVSTNDLERSRRDVDAQVFEYDHISPDSISPSNWGTFLSVRKHKKLFANFISDQFLALANLKFPRLECFFVTAGGFDNEFKGQARCAFGNSSAKYIVANEDHEE